MTPDEGRWPDVPDGRPGRDDAMAEPMTPERWQATEDLLLAALDLPESERPAFLSEACGSDDALRLEVESLLAAHASPGPADRLVDTLGARLLTGFIEGGGLEGETVGRYEIGERLGRGGMGIVYRAWDPKLERHVALKVLPGLISADDASRRRLLAEAQMAAGLEHRNICTIYEVGEAVDGRLFIAMPLYDGETVATRLESGPLGETEAIRLALQAARGLVRAHERGVIHRDIKPGNLMITRDGTLKILDFGIAQPEGAPESMGRTPGTAHYMAPEQLAGSSVDGRADLWSLGVVLYEMLTGRRPFEGETRDAVRHAVVHEEPPPPSALVPDIAPELDELVRGLLQKDPALRPGSAEEVAEALRPGDALAPGRRTGARRRLAAAGFVVLAGVAAAAAAAVLGNGAQSAGGEIRRIAVLPLANLTDDPQQDYLAAAMTDQLITQLTQVRELRVISHSTMRRYQDHSGPVREIADELGVDAVVEGSVARPGSDIRIAVRLIDGETDEPLWAGSYTRDVGDLGSLEEEVARALVRAVDIDLSPDERGKLRTARPRSPEAQAAFLRGVYLQRRHQEQGGRSDTILRQSVRELSRAVELEPEWAEAHAELARAYHWLATSFTTVEKGEPYRSAKAHARRAIRLDETFAGGHAALAFVLHNYEHDWEGAEREYRRALELAPDDSYYRWGWAIFEKSVGRYDEAVADYRRALEHAPVSPALHAQLAETLVCAGRYGESREVVETFGVDDPGVQLYLGKIALRQGQEQRALAWFERALEQTDSGTAALRTLAHAYAFVGREREARALIPELEARGEWMPAVYAEVREPERAIDQLEAAYDRRRMDILSLRCHGAAAYTDLTTHEALAGEPRFQELLRRIDFPD